MNGQKAYWIWYPGDLELYHALRQNFSRVERGCAWPAFWKSDGFRQRVTYRRSYTLPQPETFTVTGGPDTIGYVLVNDRKYPLGTTVSCPAGAVRISVHAACIGCVPAIYVDGENVFSDSGWTAEDYCLPPVQAACSRYFTLPGQRIDQWPMLEKAYAPVRAEAVNGGALFTFETELTARLHIAPRIPGRMPEEVFLGESREEALAGNACYFSCRPDPETGLTPRQAMRFAYLPGVRPEDVCVQARHQYVDIPVRARFYCDDEKLNRIFEVAAHTFSLCCDVFFLDGVKRDKWIWGGDAYQSLFVNRYLTGDREIEQRTLTALRGSDPPLTHVNTIVDYSLLWILGTAEHALAYRDETFLSHMLPRMESLMELLLSQRDENGFLIGRKGDWIYVDWAEFDRDGPLCAEQMLLAAALSVMARLSASGKAQMYRETARRLTAAIEGYFWDEEKQAYVDSWTSGRRAVTRHAAILAIVFDLVPEARKRRIAETVLFNDKVPPITTPYFRFFELDALCRMGYLKEVLEQIRAYWGGMLDAGAATFWEEYDPQKPAAQQYAMYGDPFGKSLCHAWAASPIYLLARYFIGLSPDPSAPDGWHFDPPEGFFTEVTCEFPAGPKNICIALKEGKWSRTSEIYRKD